MVRARLVAIFAVLVLSATRLHLWPILTDTTLETLRAELAKRKSQISKLDFDKDLLGIGADGRTGDVKASAYKNEEGIGEPAARSGAGQKPCSWHATCRLGKLVNTARRQKTRPAAAASESGARMAPSVGLHHPYSFRVCTGLGRPGSHRPRSSVLATASVCHRLWDRATHCPDGFHPRPCLRRRMRWPSRGARKRVNRKYAT